MLAQIKRLLIHMQGWIMFTNNMVSGLYAELDVPRPCYDL